MKNPTQLSNKGKSKMRKTKLTKAKFFLAMVILLGCQGTLPLQAEGKVEARRTEEELATLLKRFPRADANNDGVLTEEEAKSYREKLMETLLLRFPQADTNQDGVVTREEVQANLRKRQNKIKVVGMPPTHADMVYGSHPSNVLDLWLAPSDTPTPLLVFIHGGGFRGGDKRNFDDSLIENMHKEGISVASINYRLPKQGLLAEGENRYPAPKHDGARALQFLRYNASKYNLDNTRFAATGGSAGGCMLMWLGFAPNATAL